MNLYAHMTTNRDFPPRPRPGVLHLMDIQRYGSASEGGLVSLGDIDVTSPEAFIAYIAQHPEVGHVIVYDSRFPRRGRAWMKFIEKDAPKLWGADSLAAAAESFQRKRMTDPNYVPTLAEALRFPKEFVEGMIEE